MKENTKPNPTKEKNGLKLLLWAGSYGDLVSRLLCNFCTVQITIFLLIIRQFGMIISYHLVGTRRWGIASYLDRVFADVRFYIDDDAKDWAPLAGHNRAAPVYPSSFTRLSLILSFAFSFFPFSFHLFGEGFRRLIPHSVFFGALYLSLYRRCLLFLLYDPTLLPSRSNKTIASVLKRFRCFSFLFLIFFISILSLFLLRVHRRALVTQWGRAGPPVDRARSVDDLLSVLLPHQPSNQTTKWPLSNGARGKDKRPCVFVDIKVTATGRRTSSAYPPSPHSISLSILYSVDGWLIDVFELPGGTLKEQNAIGKKKLSNPFNITGASLSRYVSLCTTNAKWLCCKHGLPVK
jgi:hypothetical protein